MSSRRGELRRGGGEEFVVVAPLEIPCDKCSACVKIIDSWLDTLLRGL
jgi:hypothetical protein